MGSSDAGRQLLCKNDNGSASFCQPWPHTGPADAASGRQTESALSVMTGVADAAHGGSRLLRDRTEVFFITT